MSNPEQNTQQQQDSPAEAVGAAAGAAAGALGVVAVAGWGAALLGLLAALPKLISIGERVVKAINDAQFQNWMNDLDATIGNLEKATTDQERFDAAKALAKLTRGA